MNFVPNRDWMISGVIHAENFRITEESMVSRLPYMEIGSFTRDCPGNIRAIKCTILYLDFKMAKSKSGRNRLEWAQVIAIVR